MKTLPFPGNLETAFYDEQIIWLNKAGEFLSFISWKRTSYFEFCASFVKWFLQPTHQQITTDLRINLVLFEGNSCWFSCFIFLVYSCFTIKRLPGVHILVLLKVQTEMQPHPEMKAEFWVLLLNTGLAGLQKVQRRTWK